MSGGMETRGPGAEPRRVHFVAIGGTGMGSLAGLLASRGVAVTGSDRGVYPPMSTALERWGIPVHEGFAPEHVLDPRPDLVVIGNAVRPDNPEARAAIDAGLPYLSFPDALRELAIRDHHSVVVAGTHGKTTVTSLVAHLLHATGRDPSLLVGGIAANFGGSFREGAGFHFIVEGDEYDTAFFDKTPKFLHYAARTLVLTSVELDHADIYRDLDHVKSAFRDLIRRLPSDGTIIAATDHEGVRDVLSDAPCNVVGYGIEEAAGGRGNLPDGPPDPGGEKPELPGQQSGLPDGRSEIRSVRGELRGRRIASGGERSEPGSACAEARPVRVFRACDVKTDADGTRFTVTDDARERVHVHSPLFGRYNVENALAALATAVVLGAPLEQAAEALTTYRGVARRQQIRGEAAGVTVIDDFAHHPTAVRETVQAVRERFPGRRLVAVFEPRSNTSRRRTFQADYAASFDAADAVVLCEPPAGPIYSATGPVADRLSAADLARDLRSRHLDALSFDTPDAILAHLTHTARPGDILLLMSNGPFADLHTRILTRLRDRW